MPICFFIVYSHYNEQLEQRLYGLQKLNYLLFDSLQTNFFSSLLEDTLQGFLILILWEIFYKPCGYN